MKKSLAICLIVVLLMGQAAPALGAEAMPPQEGRVGCGTELAQQEDAFQVLMQQKLNELSEITSYGAPGHGVSYGFMPSTGTVRILVLPIEFNDYKIAQSDYDSLENRLFAEDDDPLKDNYDISMRALLHRLSYGKLDVVGDILPIYTASGNKDTYGIDGSRKLVSEALSSYFDGNPNRSYNDYDSDGDGYLDVLIVKHAGGRTAAFNHATSCVEGAIPINDENIKIKFVVESPMSVYYISDDAHELGHCMGLLDTYHSTRTCPIDDTLTDLMSGAAAHINVFFQYLLGWVDPIILTGDDPVDEITLQTAQWFGGELDQATPRAIVYIPKNEGLPVTEFYMAEYRNNTYDDAFRDKLGIILWHCDAAVNENNVFVNLKGYLKPVYRSGGTPNILGKIEFIENDFYVEGSVFSPETTPNSNFYDDVYTGIYMEVKELQKEYAVLNTGFLQAHTHEYSTGWRSDGTSHWHECECGDKKDTAAHTPMEDKAVEPTCTAPGKTAGSHCSECGYVITAQTEVSATGHSYSPDWKSDGTNHWHECECGDEKDIAVHTWDGGTVTTAPTASTAGVRTYTCTVCG